MSKDINQMTIFKFFFVTDLRLNYLENNSLCLSQEKRLERDKESLESLELLIKDAITKKIDAILIPGNLFDHRSINRNTIATLQKLFMEIEPVPVFICPGELDSFTQDSYYRNEFLEAKGLQSWSENVHIYTDTNIKWLNPKLKPDILIGGFALKNSITNEELSEKINAIQECADNNKQDNTSIKILLCPISSDTSSYASLVPELESSLSLSNTNYTLLSGPENCLRINNKHNELLALAGGTFTASSENQQGKRLAYIGEITKNVDSEETIITFEELESDFRKVVSIEINLSKLSKIENFSLEDEIDKALLDSQAQEDLDILIIYLTGFYDSTRVFVDFANKLKEKYYHVRIVNKARPNYLSRIKSDNSPENKFSNLVKELLEKEQNNKEKIEILTDSLYLGLEALIDSKVSIQDAD